VFEFTTHRLALAGLSDLPFTVGMTALWALTWLGWMWNLLDRIRKDMCLTGKIYALPATYYGIVHPGKPEDYCPCGSTRRGQLCPHYFGRSDAETHLP
jgi:hypothetical protein